MRVTAVIKNDVSPELKPFLQFSGARVVQADLSQPEQVSKLGSFDCIIHAAGYGQPGLFMANPVATIKLNTSTTLALFDLLAQEGRFLFVSTAEVYSGLPTPPFRETQIGTTNTTHPRACYIEAKRCGEAICNAYRTGGIKASSARLALAYGPGTRKSDHRVLNSFIERGITEKKITLQDAGMAKRTYCYVSDAVELLWHILLRGTQPVYNVGGYSRTTIAELAKRIGSYLQVPVIFPDDVRQVSGAPDDVCLDMTVTNREFQKARYLSFEEGLVRTIEWQRALYAPDGRLS
jgi:nucleoside-diphosphate-sugar epimerase